MDSRRERWAQLAGEAYNELLLRVGANLRRLRTERGWSQEETAHRCHVGLLLVQRVEGGKSNFTALTLARIARGLEVDVRDLLADPAGQAIIGSFKSLVNQANSLASKSHRLSNRKPKKRRR